MKADDVELTSFCTSFVRVSSIALLVIDEDGQWAICYLMEEKQPGGCVYVKERATKYRRNEMRGIYVTIKSSNVPISIYNSFFKLTKSLLSIVACYIIDWQEKKRSKESKTPPSLSSSHQTSQNHFPYPSHFPLARFTSRQFKFTNHTTHDNLPQACIGFDEDLHQRMCSARSTAVGADGGTVDQHENTLVGVNKNITEGSEDGVKIWSKR